MHTPYTLTISSRMLGLTAVGLVVSVLSACGGGGGGDGSGVGTLKLAMTDAPSCGYDHVYVTVTKIRVHQSATASDSDAGWSEMAIPAQRVDLLQLNNGVLQELGSMPLPAGRYQQVRLVLADNPANPTATNPLANSLVPSGSSTEIALSTPSGQQSGYKLQANFDVIGGQLADMVLDFDACHSIVRAGNSGRYNLKPVVAVIKRLTTAIVGYVNPTQAASVIVSTRDPDNHLRAVAPDPVTGRFMLAYLPENTFYTVVVAGSNLTTAAVTGVPVSLASGTTSINGVANPITMPVSSVATVGGSVTSNLGGALPDAWVSARQALSAGPVVDVAWTAVDPVSATYSLSLPLAAPLRASYSAGAVLSFSPDNAAAGIYAVQGNAVGYTTQSPSGAVQLSTPNSVNTLNLTLQP